MAEGFQYRVSAISGIMISVFWSIIECVMYTVFYKYSDNGILNSNGLSLTQAISYIWLAQGLWILQFMSIDSEILDKITNGDVGIELCRPLDLYSHWFTKCASGKLGTTWIRGLFTIIVGFLMPAGYALGAPSSLAGFLLFLLAVFTAFILTSSFGMLVTAIRLNITWGNGPTYILMLMSGVLSGGYLPLRLWPDFMQTFLRLQPFAGFIDIPVQLYIGTLQPADALLGTGLQLAWILLFISAGRAIMRQRLKSVIVQGG
jgi:ABC-2 type transport system permease protein